MILVPLNLIVVLRAVHRLFIVRMVGAVLMTLLITAGCCGTDGLTSFMMLLFLYVLLEEAVANERHGIILSAIMVLAAAAVLGVAGGNGLLPTGVVPID